MRRIICVLLVVVLSLTVSIAYANKEKPLAKNGESFEKPYFEIGYKSVDEAIKVCENHFKQEIKLPVMLPSVPFTHHFGRCIDAEGEFNDKFEVVYINEYKVTNHYQIWVKPSEHKYFRNPSNRVVVCTYKLKDGTEAVYGTTPAMSGRPPIANLLVFEKGGWEYVLSVDKRIENKVSAEVLVGIANSMR